MRQFIYTPLKTLNSDLSIYSSPRCVKLGHSVSSISYRSFHLNHGLPNIANHRTTNRAKLATIGNTRKDFLNYSQDRFYSSFTGSSKDSLSLKGFMDTRSRFTQTNSLWTVSIRSYSSNDPKKDEDVYNHGYLGTSITTPFRDAKGAKEKMNWIYKFTKELGAKIWKGFKNLYNNTKLANSLAVKKRKGESLTRSEAQFVRQNRKDLRNLIPFFLVWRVPILGDFLLPFFVAKFPGLLPSTFKLRQKATMEETVTSCKLKQASLLFQANNKNDVDPLKGVEEKLDKLPKTAQAIIENSDLFANLQLNALSYYQIAAVCSRINLGTRFPAWFLKWRLRKHMDYIQEDDVLLRKETVDSLSLTQLEVACFERGLQSHRLDEVALKSQLNQWLKISEAAPHVLTSLLIYAHAFKQQDFSLSDQKQISH